MIWLIRLRYEDYRVFLISTFYPQIDILNNVEKRGNTKKGERECSNPCQGVYIDVVLMKTLLHIWRMSWLRSCDLFASCDVKIAL